MRTPITKHPLWPKALKKCEKWHLGKALQVGTYDAYIAGYLAGHKDGTRTNPKSISLKRGKKRG